MKGLADEPNYSIELLGGGATLKDVIDTHVCEQALVSAVVLCPSLDCSGSILYGITFPAHAIQPIGSKFHVRS